MLIKEESVIKTAATRKERLRVIVDHALINSDGGTTCKVSKKNSHSKCITSKPQLFKKQTNT